MFIAGLASNFSSSENSENNLSLNLNLRPQGSFLSICNTQLYDAFLFFSANKPKIHYSRSHPKPSTTNPSMKASPNTPSPSRPSLSRQSSASSKRMSTRLMFGEEHCYVIDAKAYGNCGRYLNVSTILALGRGGRGTEQS